MKLTRKKIRMIIESDMQQMMDDMNIDVDIIAKRKDRQLQGIEKIKVKIKKIIDDLLGENEESANQAEIILSSGFGSIVYDAYVISELKKEKLSLQTKKQTLSNRMASNEELRIQRGGHYSSQSEIFYDFHRYQYYDEENEKLQKEISKIVRKIESIDEVLDYIM